MKSLLHQTWRMAHSTARASSGRCSVQPVPCSPAVTMPACRPPRQAVCAALRPLGDTEDALAIQASCARRPRTTTRSLHGQASGLAGPHAHAHQVAQASQLCVETELIRPAAASASSSTPRIRVAVDVDEVLGRFVYALNKFCESEYSMRHTVSDYWIYEFAKIWGCDQERSNLIVHEFFKSRHFKEGIPPIPGALQSLQRLSEHCDLVVVTSRQHVIQDQTLDWIDRHYTGIFQEVYFGNHWSLEGVSRRKSDICRAVGASLLIDDNPSYAMECAAAGIHVLLYDWDLSYPWSKLAAGQQHPLIRVVKNWSEVEAAVTQLTPTLAAARVQSIS